MKAKYQYIIVLVILFSCNKKSIRYENMNNLEKFVYSTFKYKLTDNTNNSIILILQNEDCICTSDDVELARSVIVNPICKLYNFVLIVSSKKHKILNVIPVSNKIKTFINDKNQLFNNGYIAVTDRIIIYDHGVSTYYADMHTTKPAEIKKEIFKN